MTTFVGDYPCTIDIKGRVSLPVAFKKRLSAEAQDRFVIKKDIYEKCLSLIPFDEWERQIAVLRSKLNPFNSEHNRLLRGFYKDTIEVTLDSSNRLNIPKRILDLAEITKDVILVGQDSKIEMWDKTLYESSSDSDADFAALAEKILGGNLNNA